MNELLYKIWLIIICGIPVPEGNYAVHWGGGEDDYWVWQVSPIRSILVDWLAPHGNWASHPLIELAEKYRKK